MSYPKDTRIDQLYIQVLKLKQQIITTKEGNDVIVLTRDPKGGLKNRKYKPGIWIRFGQPK